MEPFPFWERLFDYQKDAVNKLSSGKMLIGGVGSGKSCTGIAYYVKDYSYLPLYIITTAKKRNDLEWQYDLARFSLHIKSDKQPDGTVIVDSWNNVHKYINVKNAFFIFDEQRVVGYGKWSKSFIKIAHNNKWILMTATPGDHWLDFMPAMIAAGYYRNKSDFIAQHVIYDNYCTKYPKIKRICNISKLYKIRQEMSVVMDGYHKTAQLIDIYKKCEYNKTNELQIYKNHWNPFDNVPIENPSQLCYLMRYNVNTDYSRWSALYDIILKCPRLIVFYNFDSELDILKQFCEQEGFKYYEYNGHKHDMIPAEEFEWVYLVQYNAGAEGWNCIRTDTIVFWSQTYSYKQLQQAKGRIDRLNTPFDRLKYYHFISDSMIDKTITRCLVDKKKFNENLLWR